MKIFAIDRKKLKSTIFVKILKHLQKSVINIDEGLMQK